MTLTIDTNAAIDLLDKAVERKGADHVQGVCLYVEDVHTLPRGEYRRPSAGCIVGVAMYEAVGEVEALRILTDTFTVDDDPEDIVEANECGIRTLRPHLAANGVVMTDGAFSVFQKAQNHQDNGRPWGRVVESVKRDIL